LYNAPRAATIIAKTDSVCFALDRECFNHIVKDSASKKREKYEGFLAKIELLDQMDPYERSKIADALKPMKFQAGEYIVREVAYIQAIKIIRSISIIRRLNFFFPFRARRATLSSSLKMESAMHRKY
jgi:hypothetical protein